MKNKILMGLAGLACYLLFLLAQAPVGRILPWVTLPPGVMLSGVSGTLWHGYVEQVRWQNVVLGKIEWRLPLTSVLLADPVLELTLKDRQTLSGQLELGWQGGPRVRDVALHSDAEWLLGQSPLPLPVGASGPLQLTLAEARVNLQGQCQQVQGRLQWRNAVVTSPMGELQLATAEAALSCEKGKLVARLQQGSEQLSVAGRGELDAAGNYRFEGTLTPGANLPPAFAQGVSYLGPRDSQGAIRLNYVGRF
ncbi:MAG: type II secretion system protein N [Aeromonadaceae bacterium]